jgi:hypothetical protein
MQWDPQSKLFWAFSPGLVPSSIFPHKPTTCSVVSINPKTGNVIPVATVPGQWLDYYGGEIINGLDLNSRYYYYALYNSKWEGQVKQRIP